jgi:hypothetical protein
MSTITTTAPTFDTTPRPVGRRVVIAGIVAVGLVAAGAIAIPRITATTSTTTYPAVTPHDAVEHQLDSSKAQALTSAQRLQSAKVEKGLDLAAKAAAAAAATRIYAPMEFQPALDAGFTRQYVGGQLQTVPVPQLVSASVVRQQVGGQAPTYAWVPNHVTSLQQQQTGGHATYPFTGTTQHVAWTDPWVPPYDNPEWVPYIKSHYFQPSTTPTRPTHEFR